MRICCAGEVMVELANAGQQGLYHQGVAGDSFNTAVYLARQGLQVDYLTRLGDDIFSEKIRQQLLTEGIGDSLVQQCPGRRPGLYIITNDDRGERQFSYWREHSPARDMFNAPLALQGYDLFYFTGITLAIARSGLDNLVAQLRQLRNQGSTIVFDPNYRPLLWRDRQQAQHYYREVLPLCDILLPTLEDEAALWETGTEQQCHEMYKGFGIRELVIKGQDLVASVYCGEQHISRKAQAVTALDTTGAGDAFNAGYLSARLLNRTIEQAVEFAQQLSAQVVQHRGAILPRHQSNPSGMK